MRSVKVCLGCIAVIGLLGCSMNPASMMMSGAKAGLQVVRGAEAKVLPIRGTAALARYKGLRLAEVGTDVGPICPPEVVNAVRAAMGDALAEPRVKQVFPGGEPALLLNVTCRFFKEKPLIGKVSRLDLLARFVDAESKETVAEVYVEGLSESLRAHGKSDLARRDAKELMDFLTARKRR